MLNNNNLSLVSIIIPIHNEEKYIRECLQSILEFDYPHNLLELIIVDGASSDNTVKIIESISFKDVELKILHNPFKIVPISMNLGISVAKGEYIIRLDAHSYYPSNYITELIKNAIEYKTDNVGTVCLTDVKNHNNISDAIKFVLSNKYGVGNSLFRIGVDYPVEVDTVPFGCFTKEILEKVRGYDERLVRNQDIEINKRIKRIGGKILLIPEPKCIYFAREDFRSFAKSNYSNGKWNILTGFFTNDLRSLSLRHYIPLCFILSLITPILLIFIDLKFVLVSVLFLLIYYIFISFIAINNRKSLIQILCIITAFTFLHFSYGYGSLVGVFQVILDKLKIKKIK